MMYGLDKMNSKTHNMIEEKIQSLNDDEITKRALIDIFNMVSRLGSNPTTRDTKIANCREIVSKACIHENNKD